MRDDRLMAMRVFVTVVETGGFTAAARVLGSSQPFVSQTLQRLEERLGTKLLNRSTRGYSLTQEGETYLHGARRALEAADLAEAELQHNETQVSGNLRVSAPIAFGLDRVTPLLPDFLARYPNVSLDLKLTDDSVNLIDQRIDVAVRMGRLQDSGLMHKRLCGLQRIIVATPDLIARHGTPRHPEELENIPCVAWDGNREHLNHWKFIVDGEEFVFRARSRFRSNEGMSLYQSCLAGLGAMRLAEHLARPAIVEGKLVQLLEEFTAADDSAVYAVYLPDRHLLPKIRCFIDHVADAFRDPRWEERPS